MTPSTRTAGPDPDPAGAGTRDRHPTPPSAPLATGRVGSTAVELTVLGCGCSRIGNLHGPVSEEDARAARARLGERMLVADRFGEFTGELSELRGGRSGKSGKSRGKGKGRR